MVFKEESKVIDATYAVIVGYPKAIIKETIRDIIMIGCSSVEF